jgi:STE20-like kinase
VVQPESADEINEYPPLADAFKVFYADESDGRIYDEHLLRKQELRELKMLQKAEQKQFQDLTVKAQLARDQQERRFDQETTTLLRGYDTELDTLTRSQKQQVERAEQQQESDLRLSSKKIRNEQVSVVDYFRLLGTSQASLEEPKFIQCLVWLP